MVHDGEQFSINDEKILVKSKHLLEKWRPVYY